MTWWFNPSGGTFDLYDHTGSKVRSEISFDGGWGKFDAAIDDGAPAELRQEMRDIWESKTDSGDNEHAGKVLMHMMAGPIEVGQP